MCLQFIWVLIWVSVFAKYLLRLDKPCICEMNLKDGSFIEWHVPIVTTFHGNQESSFDDVWLWEVLELNVLILQVKMTQLSFPITLTTCRPCRQTTNTFSCRILAHIVDLVSSSLLLRWNTNTTCFSFLVWSDLGVYLWVLIFSFVFLNAGHLFVILMDLFVAVVKTVDPYLGWPELLWWFNNLAIFVL